MAEILASLIPLGAVLFFLVLGLVVGRLRERAHFRSICRREAEYAQRIVVTNLKRLPAGLTALDVFLCVANVAIANDAWKSWVAGLKRIIGGRLRSLESLVERARREAVLRLVAGALERGATHILNVRFETSMMTRGQGRQAGSVQVLAYGTGIRART